MPTDSPSPQKAPKRRRFVAGLIDGKSMRKAALEAGYTQSMADNAGKKIFPGARREFQKALGRKIPCDPLIRRIAEGLNATDTRLAQFKGKYSDQRDLVHWSERRRYAELVCKLMGYLVEEIEISEPALVSYSRWLTAKMAGAEYQLYLLSDHWQDFSQRIKRERGKCEVCGMNQTAATERYGQGLNVHHKTYENLWNEKPEDVTVLCLGCHEKQHSIPAIAIGKNGDR